MKRFMYVAAACFIAYAFALASETASARQAEPAPAPSAQIASAGQASDAVAANKATVQKYCVSCHNEKVKSGGLTLSTMDLARVTEHPEVWEHVIRKVRTGAMPPVGRPRPDKAVASTLVTYLETELDRAAFAQPNPGRLALARLNRAEYRNAIRDVLGLEIDAVAMLP